MPKKFVSSLTLLAICLPTLVAASPPDVSAPLSIVGAPGEGPLERPQRLLAAAGDGALGVVVWVHDFVDGVESDRIAQHVARVSRVTFDGAILDPQGLELGEIASDYFAVASRSQGRTAIVWRTSTGVLAVRVLDNDGFVTTSRRVLVAAQQADRVRLFPAGDGWLAAYYMSGSWFAQLIRHSGDPVGVPLHLTTDAFGDIEHDEDRFVMVTQRLAGQPTTPSLVVSEISEDLTSVTKISEIADIGSLWHLDLARDPRNGRLILFAADRSQGWANALDSSDNLSATTVELPFAADALQVQVHDHGFMVDVLHEGDHTLWKLPWTLEEPQEVLAVPADSDHHFLAVTAAPDPLLAYANGEDVQIGFAEGREFDALGAFDEPLRLISRSGPFVGFGGDRYLVVWGNEGGGVTLWGALVDERGVVLREPFEIGAGWNVAAVDHTDDQFVVTWALEGIRAARITMEGEVLDPGGVVLSNANRSPMTHAHDGVLTVTWWEHDATIRLIRSELSSAFTDASTRVFSFGELGAGTVHNIGFARSGTNYLSAVLYQPPLPAAGSYPDPERVLGQRFNAIGSAVGEPFDILDEDVDGPLGLPMLWGVDDGFAIVRGQHGSPPSTAFTRVRERRVRELANVRWPAASSAAFDFARRGQDHTLMVMSGNDSGMVARSVRLDGFDVRAGDAFHIDSAGRTPVVEFGTTTYLLTYQTDDSAIEARIIETPVDVAMRQKEIGGGGLRCGLAATPRTADSLWLVVIVSLMHLRQRRRSA